MKALQLERVGKTTLIEVSRPAPRENELLIRTGAATICTSDINDIRSNPFGIVLPVILGHEAAGTVAAVGAAVRGFQTGDRVATHPVHPCGSCDACKEGLAHLCERMEHFGLNRPGTFAEFFTVRQDRALKIPAALDFSLAALAEPVAVCLEAIHQARLQEGQSLLIIGDGPFGILMARLARKWGLSRIVVAGHHESRLAFAQGVQRVNARLFPDVRAELRRLGGNGYHAAIVAVGREDAYRNALDLLRPRGRVVVFSPVAGSTPIDLTRVHIKELEIVGACNDQDRFGEAVRVLSDDSASLADLVTHRFSLEDHAQALALAGGSREGVMKVAFVFDA